MPQAACNISPRWIWIENWPQSRDPPWLCWRGGSVDGDFVGLTVVGQFDARGRVGCGGEGCGIDIGWTLVAIGDRRRRGRQRMDAGSG